MLPKKTHQKEHREEAAIWTTKKNNHNNNKQRKKERKTDTNRIEYNYKMELMENRQSHVATRFNYDDDTNSVMHYGKLVKQSSMNSFFNVNDFIESSTVVVPDPDNVVESMTASNAILIVKCFIFGFIILAAIFGNMLVIVSVMQHRKLR